jgi:hypothetical protein
LKLHAFAEVVADSCGVQASGVVTGLYAAAGCGSEALSSVVEGGQCFAPTPVRADG